MEFARNVAPVVYKFFSTGVQSVPDMIPRLFRVENSTDLKEYRQGVGGMSTEVWGEYNLTGQSGHADIDRGYATTFEHEPFTARIALEKRIIKRGGIGVYETALREIGISAMQKKQVDGASHFVNAFSGSYLGADGVALCSASHPKGPDATGDTYDNTGTAAFNYTNLKAARQAMRQWTDQQKNPMHRNGRLVLLPTELYDEAMEMATARGKPGTADNDGSVAGGFQYLEWDYLTNAKDWWLLDELRLKQDLLWFNSEPLHMMIVDETTTHITYEFNMEYSSGWSDARFVYGNDVA
jgi:hypothetical protein